MCEVCHKPIPPIELTKKYRKDIQDKIVVPREELEKQLNLTPEEVAEKTEKVTALFEEAGSLYHKED